MLYLDKSKYNYESADLRFSILKVRPLDKMPFRDYHLIEDAVLIEFTGFLKVKKVKSQMAYRQDYEEWKMTNEHFPEVKLEYLEYRKLLQLVGECAMILERSAPITVTPMIEDNDLLLVPLKDDNDATLKFDYNQLSNRAFSELEESLGLGN